MGVLRASSVWMFGLLCSRFGGWRAGPSCEILYHEFRALCLLE